MRSSRTIAVAAAAAAALASGAGGAVADAPTHIAPGSVTSKSLSKGLNKTRIRDHQRIIALEKAVRALGGKIPATGPTGQNGSNGSNGAAGAKGSAGAPGAPGAAGTTGATGPQGASGAPGNDAVFRVTSLSADLDVAAPAWAKRENSCDPAGPVGAASIADGHLLLSLPSDDGGNAAAAGVFNGLNGLRLKDVERIIYSERADGGIDGYNAPYFRIYTENYAHGIVFSPSTQPTGPGSSNGWRRHVVTDGTVRYDDDAGEHPDITWTQLVADHGGDVVSQVRVVAGCGGGYTDGASAQVDNIVLAAAGESATYNFGG